MSSRAFERTHNPLNLHQWNDNSPDKNKVCSEPKPNYKVRVIYYLCHNGQLQHPHFMEVALSSSSGLYLTDVFRRLDRLRGKGLANAYSWSVKRSYKNGFVWQDLAENDLIIPTHGHEYVLKASELIPYRKTSSSDSFDLNEYKVYKADINLVNAATQTEDHSRYNRVEAPRAEELEDEEISPPPSSSSPETLESLVKPDGGIGVLESINRDRTIGSCRMKASSVLMQLISCGSINVKEQNGYSPFRQFSGRLSTRGAFDGSMSMDSSGFSGLKRLNMEDKEYFSGSLIETKMKKNGISGVIRSDDDGLGVLKRSSSYNADMICKLNVDAKEVNDVGAKCMPTKAKTLATKESQRINHD